MRLKLNLVLCPYCDKRAEAVTGEVIYPRRKDLHELKFYLCKPCDAYIGCHKDSGDPFGSLADKELRSYRELAHVYFDRIWLERHTSRINAYKWLARKLDMDKEDCHIGNFDVKMCHEVAMLSKEWLEGRIR